MGGEHRGLAFEAVDRAVDERLALEVGGVVGEEAGGEVVRAVDDDLIGSGDFLGVVRREAGVVEFDVDERVHFAEAGGGAFELGFSDPGFAVEDLALEVGGIDGVVVDEADRADAGGGEVHGGGRAEGAGTDEEDGGVFQALLAFLSDVRDEDVAGIALEFLLGEGAAMAGQVWRETW